jgi:dienelactone hydrolase
MLLLALPPSPALAPWVLGYWFIEDLQGVYQAASGQLEGAARMTQQRPDRLHTEYLDYADRDVVCQAYLAHDGSTDRARPCIIVAHAWDGQNQSIRAKTEQLARLGYVGFALDLYGKGVRGGEKDDNSRLMAPFLEDRALLRRRLEAAVATARQHPLIDPDRLVVLGYCFGGLCALDAARSAAPGVRGAVSFHGVLKPPVGLEQPRITAKVLILHGWEDPVAPPADVLAISRELTEAGADWQLHAYGHAMHAFTFSGVNMPERGIRHDPAAERRSWTAMLNFLEEVLGDAPSTGAAKG